jgi:hypothetical protein
LNPYRQLPPRPPRKFDGKLRTLGSKDGGLKIVDVDPGGGDSQCTAGATQPAGTDMVTGREWKLALGSLFPNDGLIGDANQLFAAVSDPHHELASAPAAEHGAGQVPRVVTSCMVVRRLSASHIV